MVIFVHGRMSCINCQDIIMKTDNAGSSYRWRQDWLAIGKHNPLLRLARDSMVNRIGILVTTVVRFIILK